MMKGAVARIRKYMVAWFTAAAIIVAAAVPALPAKAMSNEEAAFFYLTDELGYNVTAACGIMANIRHESNFHPGSYGGGGSYGLCQWTGGRRYACESYCYDHGFGDDSLYGQLSFLTHEIRTVYPGLYNYLMSVDNTSEGAYNAAYRFCYDYERPANKGSRSASRGSLASGSIWNKYKIYAYDMWLDTDKGRVYHYTDGSVHYGWLELDGDTYYLDQDGILKTGLFSADGATYFADEDGILQYGWNEVAGNTYFFDEETGAMKVGWTEVDGTMMFFDSNGKLTGVNEFNEKHDISEAEIQDVVIEKESEPETTVNAPAAEPMPLPDKLSDVAKSIQDAGTDSQNSAAAVATPGNETEIKTQDIAPSTAVEGNTIDTTRLEVGTNEESSVVMENTQQPVGGEEKITFEGAN